ncbi:MAG: hypothetical protein EXX96DRAFT_598119 [Benjaminiella poitrasii]|nr:MAG: hypothetical protein EXX96DRAFT_598119 [Benjaminiella poitrasii]
MHNKIIHGTNQVRCNSRFLQQLLSLGVNKNSLDYLLLAYFYAQIVRPQLEYGLAITTFNLREIRSIKSCQNQCMRQIFGGRPFTSTKVMLHLLNLPTMKDRVSILQAQFLLRSFSLFDDALLTKLLPYLQLQHFKKTKKQKQFVIDSHHSKLQEKHVKLLSQCRNDLIVDRILWIPKTSSGRSRCLRWRLGWLPLDKPQACPCHPNVLFRRSHSISCLDMHKRLQMLRTIDDPLSYLLNQLPPTFLTKKSRRPRPFL